MTLTTSAELLARAGSVGAGLAAFNVITLEYAEGIVAAAERSDSPVILQLSENATAFHGGDPRPITAAMAALAERAAVPVALHLDHVEDEQLLRRSAAAGFSSVMFDAGRLPYRENVSSTRSAAIWAHEHGLTIEAELGYVGGKASQVESAHAPGVRTDPDQAAEYVAATGVDALAVAVGSSHAMTSRTASLDTELIAQIAATVDVPLVLHGSSGVPDDELVAGIAAGMRKINIGTLLSTAFTRGVRAALGTEPAATDPRRYLGVGRDELTEQAAALFEVIARAGRLPSR